MLCSLVQLGSDNGREVGQGWAGAPPNCCSVPPVLCCAGGFALGLPFVQRSGSYLVAVFDDYVATLPVLAVVTCETVAVAWVYGAER